MLKTLSIETKIFLGIIIGTIVLIGGAALMLGNGSSSSSSDQKIDQTTLAKSDSHALGLQNTKVTVVEFSDFECPACQAAQSAVDQMLTIYKDKIRFVYREFPLPIHQYAFLAAQGAEAAGLQGKFWEMHDQLFKAFETSPNYIFDTGKAIALANSLNLDVAKFAADLDSDAVRQIVLNDQADGNKAGLAVTPTFFINGTKFDGSLSVDEFSKEIDSRLK